MITSSGENNRSIAEHVRHILQRLARDELGPGDWKKLALHWNFTHEQIQAIEHQYTGSESITWLIHFVVLFIFFFFRRDCGLKFLFLFWRSSELSGTRLQNADDMDLGSF